MPTDEQIQAGARTYCLMSAAGYGRRGEPLSWGATPEPLRERALKIILTAALAIPSPIESP